MSNDRPFEVPALSAGSQVNVRVSVPSVKLSLLIAIIYCAWSPFIVNVPVNEPEISPPSTPVIVQSTVLPLGTSAPDRITVTF